MQTRWDIIGKLKASEHRMRILESLQKAEMTPKELVKKLDAKFSHVSRALRELKDMGLVECLTPNLHVGRIYSSSIKGKQLLYAAKQKRVRS